MALCGITIMQDISLGVAMGSATQISMFVVRSTECLQQYCNACSEYKRIKAVMIIKIDKYFCHLSPCFVCQLLFWFFSKVA